eukprot:gene6209-biopygen7912
MAEPFAIPAPSAAGRCAATAAAVSSGSHNAKLNELQMSQEGGEVRRAYAALPARDRVPRPCVEERRQAPPRVVPPEEHLQR